MDSRDQFAMFFMGIAAIRFHPRNMEASASADVILRELEFSACVAEGMIAFLEERYGILVGGDSR